MMDDRIAVNLDDRDWKIAWVISLSLINIVQRNDVGLNRTYLQIKVIAMDLFETLN